MTTIIAASGLQGETTHIDMTIVCELMRQDLGVQVRLIPDTDILRKLEWLKNGYVDILYYGALCPMHLQANRPDEAGFYNGPFQIRLFGSSHYMAAAPAVRTDSSIKTIYDITPETIWATPTGSLGPFEQGILAWIGIDPNTLTQTQKQTEATPKGITHKHAEMSFRALLDGKADVNFADAVTPWVRAASERNPGFRFLDLPVNDDPEGAARFHQIVPFGKLIPAPRETASEIWGKTCFLGTANLWCRDDLDTELAYTITKWFDQNHPRFKDDGAKLLSYTRASFRESLDVAMAPVHEGSIRYFNEIGIWTPEDEKRQQYNLRLLGRYCELWEQACTLARANNIEIDSANQNWLGLWSRLKKEFGIADIRQMSNREIEAAL